MASELFSGAFCCWEIEKRHHKFFFPLSYIKNKVLSLTFTVK